MRLVNCGVTFLACSVAIAAGLLLPRLGRPIIIGIRMSRIMPRIIGAASRSSRGALGSADEAVVAVPMRGLGGPGSMPTYQPVDGSAAYASVPQERRARHARGHAAVEQSATFGGFGGGSLVAEARRYLGTNPTGRSSLWCGAFMDKVLRETGHKAAAISPRAICTTAAVFRARRSAPSR